MIAVLASLALHGALLALSVAAGAVAFRRLAGGPLVSIGAGLVTAGVLAYITGIVWFDSPAAGIWVSRSVPVLCLVYVATLRWREPDAVDRVLRPLGVPALLAGLWAGLVLALGFLYGGEPDAANVAASRFSHQLPIDNQLPYMLARHIEQVGHVGPPSHFSSWLSSDRPPLQSAFVLSQTLWHRGDASSLLDYQVLATLMQSTWVAGVWALALVLTTRRSVRALMIAGCAACGQVLLNSFYTWPKLLAAAFVLVAVALVLHRGRMGTTARLSLAAAAAALGYLSHGGAVFALIPVALVGAWQALRGRTVLRTLGAALGSALVLVVPWALYQRIYDPPGDRLLKWMLAEVHEIDPRSVVQIVEDRYRQVGAGGAIHNKIENFAQVLGLPPQQIPPHADVDSVIRLLRSAWFYSLVPSFGVLIVLALGWVVCRRAQRAEVRAQGALVGVLVAGVVGWCLLMFGPRTTVTHQGTYAFALMGVMALVGAGAFFSVRATTVVVALQAVVTLVVYVPALPIARVEWTQSAHPAKQALVVLAVCGIGMIAVLAAYARGARDRRVPGLGSTDPSAVPTVADVRTDGPEAFLERD